MHDLARYQSGRESTPHHLVLHCLLQTNSYRLNHGNITAHPGFADEATCGGIPQAQLLILVSSTKGVSRLARHTALVVGVSRNASLIFKFPTGDSKNLHMFI